MINRNTLVLIGLMALPLFSFAQYFSGGPIIGPEWNLMVLEEIKSGQLTDPILETTSTGGGFILGGQVRYDMEKPYFLRSGIVYRKSTFKHKISGLKFAEDLAEGTTSMLTNEMSVTSLSIPLEIGSRATLTEGGTIDFVIGLGAWINLSLFDETEAVINRNGTEMLYPAAVNVIDASIISGTLFLGVEWAASDKVVLGLEPHLKYTPNQFELALYGSKASTSIETGVTLRMRMRK